MLKIILPLISVITFSTANGQSINEKFRKPEIPAEYPGGYQNLYHMISDSLEYPLEAEEQGIEGKVYVRFIIDESGDIVDESVEIFKTDNELLNQAAINVIKKSSNWKPAMLNKNGPAIKQQIVLPITFKVLTEKEKKKLERKKHK